MPTQRQAKDTHHKALDVNLDARVYGSIAEIGAGQETARWFFRVGGAAGTLAKTMSAYDMQFSDAIYGPAPRYVSRERLQAMLNHEFELVVERLDATRGAGSAFFAFANTVAARSYSRKENGQGWLGMRFQTAARAEPSQIVVHVHLMGQKSLQDQESLGILGVNLIHGALYLHDRPEALLEALLDNLYPELVEIDMIDFQGPAFAGVDNRLMALRLVQKGLAPAAMFLADGRAVYPADALHKKAVLVERSRFRPPTHLNIRMLACARAQFIAEREVRADEVFVLSEMTLNNLMDDGDIDVRDFLHRTEILCALGKNVLISNLGEYYRLAAYLFRYTQRPMGVAMGVPTLKEIFDEKYYTHLPGGILESFGRLFKYDLRLYVSPCLGDHCGDLMTVETFQPAPHLHHLYAYLYENGLIKGLSGIEPGLLHIYSQEVLRKIRCGEPDWESLVPEEVARMIHERHLFGCGEPG